MSNFEYGSTEVATIPSAITQNIIQSSDKTRMGQTGKHGDRYIYILLISSQCTYMCHRHIIYHDMHAATQMWTLARLLPIIIGHLIPEEDIHWKHYLQLLDIMDIVFSEKIYSEVPGFLEVQIEENLSHFVDLYKDESVIPKMHFLIHVPRFLARYIYA